MTAEADAAPRADEWTPTPNHPFSALTCCRYRLMLRSLMAQGFWPTTWFVAARLRASVRDETHGLNHGISLHVANSAHSGRGTPLKRYGQPLKERMRSCWPGWLLYLAAVSGNGRTSNPLIIGLICSALLIAARSCSLTWAFAVMLWLAAAAARFLTLLVETRPVSRAGVASLTPELQHCDRYQADPCAGLRSSAVVLLRSWRGTGCGARSLIGLAWRSSSAVVRCLQGVCQLTGTVIVSETTPSSSSVTVASPKVTSVISGVHWLFGHVGVAGSGFGSALSSLNLNWPLRGVASGPLDPETETSVC